MPGYHDRRASDFLIRHKRVKWRRSEKKNSTCEEGFGFRSSFHGHLLPMLLLVIGPFNQPRIVRPICNDAYHRIRLATWPQARNPRSTKEVYSKMSKNQFLKLVDGQLRRQKLQTCASWNSLELNSTSLWYLAPGRSTNNNFACF